MRGSSAGSLAHLTDGLAAAIAGGGDGAVIGDDLFAAAGTLRESAALRRAATDPSAPSEAKSGLMSGLFGDKLGAAAADLVATAAGLRWATGADLVGSLEQLAVVAHVRGAEAAGDGDRLEDELFSFAQSVSQNRDLRDALSDPSRSVADKQALVTSLLGTKALPATVRLASRSVEGANGTISAALTTYSQLAAQARSRLVAKVTVASALGATEQDRLAAVLARDYGQTVHLNIVINPDIVGGIRVEIGDQVIDGTVSARIDDATRRLAG